jgi:protein phosphatase
MLRFVDDLVPIGEFSARSGLSPKRLRSYAAVGLLVPAAVDAASGYRYYSPGQVREAQLIDALRDAGMPLGDIGALVRDPSGEQLDAWATRVQIDAEQRQKALDLARRLLAIDSAAVLSVDHEHLGKVPMRTMKTVTRTEVGRVRDNNEDAVVSTDRLAVVADGMGGHPGGEVASAVAVSLVQAAYSGRSLDELQAAVLAANRAIWDRASGDAKLEGMGTTICAAGLTEDGNLALVNVGDSRAYVWRDGALRQLTHDHSLTAELVRRGELDEQEVLDHPLHGVIYRALGIGPDVELDSATHSATAGDRVLLCSDGLVNEVTDDEIASAMMATNDIQATADDLVGLALSRGGRDNVSVVIAEICA